MSTRPDPDAPQPVQAAPEQPAPVLVPKGISLGLLLAAVALSLGSFIPQPPENRGLGLMALVFGLHVLAIPLAAIGYAQVMNRLTGDNIHWRNAATLGLLLSCVWMLWKMGTGV